MANGLDTEITGEMLAALPDPLFVLTESGRYAAVVGGQDERLYHDGSPLVGRYLQDVMPASTAAWFREQIQLALDSGRLHTIEYDLAGDDVDGLDTRRGPDGRLWFEARIQPMSVRVEGERAVVWVARNITTRRRLEAELRRISETDELTGTYNRRKLMEELRRRVEEFRRDGRPSTLILFDLDHFKQVNDNLGHAVGDQVLCEIANLCRGQIRDVDVLARVGGEEFAALLFNTTLETGEKVAERLRTTIGERPLHVEGHTLKVTISAGVTTLYAQDDDLDSVLWRGDEALYRAKREGRNRIIVDSAA